MATGLVEAGLAVNVVVEGVGRAEAEDDGAGRGTCLLEAGLSSVFRFFGATTPLSIRFPERENND